MLEITPDTPQSHWQDLDLQIDPAWNSENPKHRLQIRTALQNQYGGSCLDLEILPRPERGYASISHSKEMGGYVWAPFPVGMDLETTSREITSRALQRIASPREIDKAPHPLYIWLAKEAAFKAVNLAGRHETAVSSIEIRDWKLLSHRHYEFSFFTSKIDSLEYLSLGRISPLDRTTLGLAALFS